MRFVSNPALKTDLAAHYLVLETGSGNPPTTKFEIIAGISVFAPGQKYFSVAVPLCMSNALFMLTYQPLDQHLILDL